MSVTVFLSNTNIQIAVGKGTASGVKVKQFISAAIPEGAVLNGVVMDEEALSFAIADCWKKNKLPKSEVTLILNSPQLRANIIEMPLLNEKKTTEYVARETKDAENGRFTKAVSAWYLIDKDTKAKSQRVISEMAEAEFVNTYVAIFGKIGVKIDDIHDGVNLAIRLLQGTTHNNSVVYMILDGNSLVTIFFSQGKYFYHSTRRLFTQPGTPEFAKEIFNSISEIRQFASAQRLDDQIEDIRFAGLGDQQVARLSNDILNIDSLVNISSVSCPSFVQSSDAKQFPYFVYPCAGLLKINSDRQTLLTATKKSADKFINSRNRLKVILPAAGFLLLLVIIYLILVFIGGQKKKTLAELNSYNTDPDNVAQITRYDEITDVVSGLGGRQGGVNLLNEYLDTYPIPDSTINDEISEAAKPYNVKVIYNSYNADTGVFSITAQSRTVEKINQFIADLMGNEMFAKIDYTGYSAIKDNGGWQINVVCTLAPREVEETPETEEVTEEAN